MRKVIRAPEPDSLRENKETWTKELKEQIIEKGSYAKVSATYTDRYRQSDVKAALEGMYSGLCCYCESKIGVSDYPHIEHLRPKAIFHDFSFEWDNLHWCCAICNNIKGDQWNEDEPILDPCKDDPKEHLEFIGRRVGNITGRGQTTINHADLNRTNLKRAREKILIEIMEDIEYIRFEKDDQKKWILRDRLMALVVDGEEYCSFIKHLVERYLDKEWVERK